MNRFSNNFRVVINWSRRREEFIEGLSGASAGEGWQTEHVVHHLQQLWVGLDHMVVYFVCATQLLLNHVVLEATWASGIDLDLFEQVLV